MKLGLAERLAESVRGNVAQFPDGEIRWTEDGTNGLSLVESDAKILESQIKCVRDAMKGMECANEAGTVWILNDDFLFGYSLELDEKRKDDLKFVLIPRRKVGDAPAEVAVIIEFMPSQRVLDSIAGSFYGDKTARANVRLLRDAGLVSLATE